MHKGLFVTFEGGEGSGKSTLVRLVADQLTKDGFDCLITREPGGTDIAEQIRNILLTKNPQEELLPEAEALLFAAARTQHVETKIKPAVAAGKIVISDRWLGSSVAYQGYARGLGVQEVLDINDFGIKGYRPDMEFFIDILPEDAFKRITGRGAADRIESEGMDFHNKVYNGLKINHANNTYSIKVNGYLRPEQITKYIVELIETASF